MKKIFVIATVASLLTNPAFAYGKLDENTINGFVEGPLTPYNFPEEVLPEEPLQEEIAESESITEPKTEPVQKAETQPNNEPQVVQTQLEDSIRPEAQVILQTQVVQTNIAGSVATSYPEAPVWEDYVPEKYQNPRSDFTLGGTIAELSTGIVLVHTLFLAPIGIPLIVHGSTKFKHIAYTKKKANFQKGLIYAETIKDPTQRETYYKHLLRKCDLTEEKKQQLADKQAKKVEKLEKITQEEFEKINNIK